METQSDPLGQWVEPSTTSTLAFLAIVGFICGAWVVGIRKAWPGGSAQPVKLTLLGLLLVLSLTALAAESGFLAAISQSPAIALYLGGSNLLALVLALSPVGARLVQHVPVKWLVGVHVFRLPLELVLHAWYEQGSLPVQMTYTGANFDIATGVLALLIAPLVPRLGSQAGYWVTAGFTVLGLGLLLNVIRVAVGSLPSPLRSYFNDPPVLLAFHAPYTWIVPMCVSGALFGHVIAGRWLLSNASRVRSVSGSHSR